MVFRNFARAADGGDIVIGEYGSMTGSEATFGVSTDNGDAAYIGTRSDFYFMFKGTMHDVRLSNVARTTDWLLTEYRNQNGDLVVTARGVGVRTERVIEQK
jgi:hypothetical protein